MRARGFTLIELVAVIVLLGIIGSGVTGYITTSVGAYNEIVRRDELAQTGRFTIERVSRELRRALPGSVRTNGNCLEFVPVVAGSSYFIASPTVVNAPIAPAPVASTFDVVDFVFTDAGANYFAAIYPLENVDVYAAGAAGPALKALNGGNPVGAASAGVRAINLAGAATFPSASPTLRVFITTQPISFCVVGTELRRYQNYGFNDPQITPSGGDLLAERIQLTDGGAVTPFSYAAGTQQRSGVVSLDFRFLDRDNDDEWIRLNHDVAVRNAP